MRAVRGLFHRALRQTTSQIVWVRFFYLISDAIACLQWIIGLVCHFSHCVGHHIRGVVFVDDLLSRHAVEGYIGLRSALASPVQKHVSSCAS